MPYMIYSAEDFPAKQTKNVAYSSSIEYIEHNGFRVSPVKAGEWTPIQRLFQRREYDSYMDKIGRQVMLSDDQMAKAIRDKFADRGVAVLSEDDYRDEKKREVAEFMAKEANLAFRRQAVENYEMQLQERKVTGKGRAYPTPYEEQCYDILGLPKPYSIETFRAERMPGDDAAKRIADAITGALAAAQR